MSEKECKLYRPNLCGIPYSCKSPSWYNCKIVDAGRELFNSWKPKEPTPVKHLCLECLKTCTPALIYRKGCPFAGKKINTEPITKCSAFQEAEPIPSKCEFCGRDLIFYKKQWICGHGCMKPAVKPKEKLLEALTPLFELFGTGSLKNEKTPIDLDKEFIIGTRNKKGVIKETKWLPNHIVISRGEYIEYKKLKEKKTKKILATTDISLSAIFQKCYHQWSYFNKWCQACCEFGHGVIVSHCFKCGKYWDKEFGFWSQEEINNQFFNEFFHDNFPKNNKKIAQNTDKKSKN